ncbi:RagB/SusD family nutrient uptake outer membrane protein [Sphingobacterium spiritivorum]|uniref:RagB/SusD family nutrient uptake outer membrane protein n=1 Tax=Sphingobacterium spiritivorum TaxID=258 RepID=UPI003DA2EA6B
MKKYTTYLCLFLMGTVFSSCDKYLDIQPVGTVVPKTEADFRALMTSGYQSFPDHKSYLNLRTDELQLDENSTDLTTIKDIHLWNDQNPDATTLPYAWVAFYKSIFYANHVISKAEEEAGNTEAVQQIRAEAYLMRAYAHFELLNSYAEQYNAATAATDKGVPISTKIDLEQKFPASTVEAVYKQIEADMQAGNTLLNVNDQPTAVKYRFSKRSYYAFEARLRLYKGEWKLAMEAAEKALAIKGDLVDLNKSGSLLPNDFESAEMIQAWEEVGKSNVSTSTFISAKLLGLYNQKDDLRFSRYFGKQGSLNYVSLKGGNIRYNVSFRNAELYLIIAETAARLGDRPKATGALTTLLKNRLTPTYFTTRSNELNAMSDADLLKEIIAERARELALEGLRWNDMKRTDRPEVIHTFFGKEFHLIQNDPRYVIRYPKEAIEKNPDL